MHSSSQEQSNSRLEKILQQFDAEFKSTTDQVIMATPSEKITAINGTETKEFETLLAEEIGVVSVKTSEKFFAEPIDKNLQEAYQQMLAIIKAKNPEHTTVKKTWLD